MRRVWRDACGSVVLAIAVVLSACGAQPDGREASDDAAGDHTAGVEARAGAPTTPRTDEARVLGTIHATLDGQEHTWYVVSDLVGPQQQPYSSALWWDPGDGTRLVSVGGFDTEAPPFESFGIGANGMPVDFGSYDGSVMVVTIELPEGGGASTSTLGEGMSSLSYMATLTMENLGSAHTSADGTIEVTEANLADGLLALQGRFSGTLEAPNGSTIAVTDGSFEAARVPDLESITGGD